MQDVEMNKSYYFPALQIVLLKAVAEAYQHLLAFNNQIHHCYTQHWLANNFLQVSRMKSMGCHLLLIQNCHLNTKRQISPLVQLFQLRLSSLKLRIHSLKLHNLSEINYILRTFNMMINLYILYRIYIICDVDSIL